MYRRILVPTDFSEASSAALMHAKTLAAQFGASLHLIHVVGEPTITGAFDLNSYVPEWPIVTSTGAKSAESRLIELLSPAERSRFRATSEVFCGPAAATIVDRADDLCADLIVMGTHGRTGVTHALMGSVAERVVRHARCPVLTVHAMPSAVPLRAWNWAEATAAL